ncbi:MAG: DUF116 domain-containing protein [Methanosphaera sp.]|nr:DUF116 domain-containing protein [Methanosphaera sp.]
MDLNLIFIVIGQIVVILAIILVIIVLITSILGSITMLNKRLILPNVLIHILPTTAPILKYILRIIGKDELIIDRLNINITNSLNKHSFKQLDAKDVIMVLPHCLRGVDCPAKLGTSGLECVQCGKCSIGHFEAIAQEKDIAIYVVPGSTFVKRVIKQRPFVGVIGVACPVDLNEVMMSLSNYIVMGVYLLNDGCIHTMVNEDDVIELMNILKPVTNYKVNSDGNIVN